MFRVQPLWAEGGSLQSAAKVVRIDWMDKKQEEFLKRLRETFRIEAGEHLRTILSGILEMEKGLAADKQDTILETVFREAHSLKGAARAVNLMEIESVCQALESVFWAVKRRDIGLSQPLYDLLHTAVSLIGDLIPAGGAEQGTPDQTRVGQVVRELGESLREPPSQSPKDGSQEAAAETPRPMEAARLRPQTEATILRPVEKAAVPESETVRISTARLNSILLQAEEMLSTKLALGQHLVELREANAALASWGREVARLQPELRALLRGLEKKSRNGDGVPSNGRGDTSTATARLAAFALSSVDTFKSLQSKLTLLAKSGEQDRRALSTMIDTLLEDTRKALMLPFAFFLEALPMAIRDLARNSGKELNLVIQGAEIEVDRRILEEMKDPLLHLVRNCVDHGIEKPQDRELRKKPRQGVITIAISQREGSKVEILVSDDGSGIDLAGVQRSAVKSGVVSQEKASEMDNAAIASLIFQSGVTTSPMLTDLSGRGLGLAIVREKVDKLGGALKVETRLGAGTSFRMSLPLTLTAFRGLLVRSEEQLFIVPSVRVVHVLRLNKGQIKSVENRETIEHEDKVISLVRLGEVLGLPRASTPGDAGNQVYVMVLSFGERQMGFVVDRILDEQEVLVKSLGQQLPLIKNIAGAAVLGNGKVAPVLNVSDLMQSALNVRTLPALREGEVKSPQRAHRRLIVAEDSITTRTLLKNILESAGYTVRTAVDGLDALTSLRTEEFDLVVSDVDMPRMNGFGLTAAIRADKRLAELPVVLVTALDSREDRERGVDVGANAYIVKSSFEQSNLLEVVRRLV
jgi:two-component system, chemotaxis family, sensor kinase CheA